MTARRATVRGSRAGRPAVLLALVLALCACERQVSEPADALARVNGRVITEEELDQYLELREAREPEPEHDADPERQALEEMIDRLLLTQHAEDTGLDRSPEVESLLARVRENILVQAVIQQILAEQPITEKELRQRFQAEVAATHQTEYLVSHILTKDEEEAKRLIRALEADGDFAQLARENSIDVESGANGGRLGWINQGMVVPEFFQGIARLEKGAITRTPVKSQFGWHVIRVEDTRPARIPTFEEFMADAQTKANFYRKLQDERVEAVVKELRAAAAIEIKDR